MIDFDKYIFIFILILLHIYYPIHLFKLIIFNFNR